MTTLQHDNKTYKVLYCKHTDCKMCKMWNHHKLYSKTIDFAPFHCYICHYVSKSYEINEKYNFIYNDDKLIAKLLCKDCFENNENLSKTILSYNLNPIILKYIHFDEQFTN